MSFESAVDGVLSWLLEEVSLSTVVNVLVFLKTSGVSFDSVLEVFVLFESVVSVFVSFGDVASSISGAPN